MTTKVSNNGEAAASAQNAQKKYSPVFHNWKCNVRSNRKMQIILTILHMLAAPAVILAAIISIYVNHEIDDAEVYFIIGIITTAIAGFMGIFIAVDSFKCLYSRSVVDMRLSLPLRADQRFASNFLAGLFTYTAPFLASQVVSLLMICYGFIFMEGRTFYYEEYTYFPNETHGKWVLKPYECEFFSELMPYYLKLILCGILVMLMLYALTVLVTVCCGSKFECIAYSIIINAVIPLTILMVTLSMFDNIYGLNPENNALKIFMLTSPAGGIFTAVAWMEEDFLGDYILPAVWVLSYLLITAAFVAVSFFLYRKRRAEQVSKPFVFKLLYYIILTGGMFCIYSVFFMSRVSIIPTIITTAVIYMIFEVVTNRGFRKFWLSGIKYAVTIVSAFLIIFTAQKTDGFGALWRVPSAAVVTSVEIQYDGFYNDFTALNGIVLKDKENIKAVISAHENLLDNYKETCENMGLSDYSSYYSGYYYYGENRPIEIYKSLTIKYKLAGGGSIERSYLSNFTPETAEILSVIDISDEYKTQIAEKYKEQIMYAKSQYEDSMNFQKANNRTDYLGYTANLYSNLRSYANNDFNDGISMYYLCNHNFFEHLSEAYAKDIMAINYENYYCSEIPEQYNLYCERVGIRLSIPGSFENTLTLLSEYDFKIPKNEDFSDAELYIKLLTSEVTMFSADEWRELAGIGENDVLRSTYSTRVYINNIEKNLESRYYIFTFNEDMFDILRNAQPRNIVGENCYTINVSGSSYVIPAEFQDAAERAAAGRTPYSEVLSKNNSEELERLRKTAAYGASTYSY